MEQEASGRIAVTNTRTVASPSWRRVLKASAPYLLILPAYAALSLVLIYPIFRNVYLSLWNWRLLSPSNRTFVGLANYVDLFNTPLFWQSLRFTLLFTALTVIASLVLGLLTALLVSRLGALKRLVTPILILPYMVAPIAVGLIWRLLWNREYGLVNYILSLFGVGAVSWLSDSTAAFIAVTVSEVWRTTPFVSLLLLAGLAAIPSELYEAARVDGASGRQMFRFVTLPLLGPSMTIALLFVTIFTLRVFDLIYILTGGGPGVDTLPLGLLVYQTYFRHLSGGTSAAISVVLFLIGLAISLFYIRATRRTWEAT